MRNVDNVHLPSEPGRFFESKETFTDLVTVIKVGKADNDARLYYVLLLEGQLPNRV